ncbi:hypothetical protein O181_096852 [Austropuccinia psidii MF-1]|uniref:Uncharacterized protein n=1 Tax=Austropuccinia psidii MF-1 TaxID=1389203 RepID=A0A9Q3PDW9_9BASI|nr:hypothetical protein [Austropuccinia psidii MF-1]
MPSNSSSMKLLTILLMLTLISPQITAKSETFSCTTSYRAFRTLNETQCVDERGHHHLCPKSKCYVEDGENHLSVEQGLGFRNCSQNQWWFPELIYADEFIANDFYHTILVIRAYQFVNGSPTELDGQYQCSFGKPGDPEVNSRRPIRKLTSGSPTCKNGRSLPFIMRPHVPLSNRPEHLPNCSSFLTNSPTEHFPYVHVPYKTFNNSGVFSI